MCVRLCTESQYKIHFKLYIQVKHLEKYWPTGSNVTCRVKCLQCLYANMEIVVEDLVEVGQDSHR